MSQPCCGHYQLHIKFMPLDLIDKFFFSRLAIANHGECHFKFQIRNCNAKVITCQCEDTHFLKVITQSLPIMFTIEPIHGDLNSPCAPSGRCVMDCGHFLPRKQLGPFDQTKQLPHPIFSTYNESHTPSSKPSP